MIIAVGVGQADAADSHLTEYLVKAPLAEIMPGADRLGPVEGTPPAATAYTGQGRRYVFLNADVVNATGYSGRPINVVIGIDTNVRSPAPSWSNTMNRSC